MGKKHWYEHVPKLVDTSDKCKVIVLWNQLKTDKTIQSNKPGTIIRDSEEGTYVLIGIETSGNKNSIKVGTEEVLIYKDLTLQTRRM